MEQSATRHGVARREVGGVHERGTDRRRRRRRPARRRPTGRARWHRATSRRNPRRRHSGTRAACLRRRRRGAVPVNPTWPARPRRNRARPPPRSGRVGSRTGGAEAAPRARFVTCVHIVCLRLRHAPAADVPHGVDAWSVSGPAAASAAARRRRAMAISGGAARMASTRAVHPISSEDSGPGTSLVAATIASARRYLLGWPGVFSATVSDLAARRRPRPPPMPIRSTHSRWSRTRCSNPILRSRSTPPCPFPWGRGPPPRALAAAGGGGRRGGVQSATGLTGDGRLTW